ncbi:MAG: alpha/beta-type small acid-soluble spore protein [Firmicutes bacterium]|uniref:Small, acid-soluble spore protein, alpha/beta type n=1 Tax=Melghirimyces thermohalophilus TaxID=1236220 RepID=A0A1G6KMB9_9BACL|nr:alpha/beta-type small acid-soluble spore protein [Melghirimyces thermohalophilus]MDA8353564.1 alpha/beta-type small acid-soluble spore protein [Bacillota bacterium]SDC32114.1 Small, acid-soluble spore protein, alpha/beta type [Melghirimyces thermohalophilus]
MARRRRNQLLVPEARQEMKRLKSRIISQQLGWPVQGDQQMKAEMARQAGVPYQPQGDNGEMTTAEAGKMGGAVGGQMVRELVQMAQEQMTQRKQK